MKHKDSLFTSLSNPFTVRNLLILFMFLSIEYSYAQLSLHFDDNNLNIVKWTGDIGNFKINTGKQLQLSTTGAGESAIFTKYQVPDDSIEINLYFKMQFAPSNDNYSKIYLFTDQPKEAGANGYYLKLGENGTNDAIQLYKLVNGISTLLGAGTNGAIALDPAQARVQMKLYRNGKGTINTDYSGQQQFEADIDFFDPALIIPDSMYFGIYCKYTSTRSDKFFYDDIYIKKLERDTVAPFVISAQALNNRDVIIRFDKLPETMSTMSTTTYTVNHGVGNPTEVLYNTQKPLEAILRFADGAIQSNNIYTLIIKNLRNINNYSVEHEVHFSFIDTPQEGDLIITEVLTDPYTGGEDFIEIYNKSPKHLKLDSLIVVNKERGESKLIRTTITLQPGNYTAISKNIAFLKDKYLTPDTALFIEATLPALNVASANITLQYNHSGKLITLDSFDYRQNMHFSLLKNTKGISLERLFNDKPTNDINNWHSASADKHFATPGYKNSNNQSVPNPESNDFVYIDKKVFTPDGDGIDDVILLHYNLDKSGYLATIRIFDSNGFPVIDLANNLLIAPDVTIKWDGLNASGTLVKTGMYIVYSSIFHPDGEVKSDKKVIVAAQKM